MNRYQKRRFHEDDLIDKQIKALMLLYDYQVYENKYSYTKQLALLDDWIEKFVDVGYYEVVGMFKVKRKIILKQIAMNKREKMKFHEYLGLKFRWVVRKIRIFFTNIKDWFIRVYKNF